MIDGYCRICGEVKPKESFYKKNKRVCIPCANQETILWQKNNPEAVKRIKRRTKLKEKYGLSENEYFKMLALQNGGCAICEIKESRRNLDVDHCHTTGRIRGILCEKCNKGLGMFKDDLILFEKAATYLRENHN